MSWIRVTYIENIPVRQGRSVKLGPFTVAVFNLGDGRFQAVENGCPHRNGPLADGIVAGSDVICPLHNWRFSLESGQGCNQQSASACIRRFDTQVVDGVIMVAIPVPTGASCGV